MTVKHLVEPGMLPEMGVHLIGGAPFAGKSTLEATMIKSQITGQSFLEGLTFNRLEPEEIGIIFTDRPMTDNDLWLGKLNLFDVQRYAIADDPKMIRELEIQSKSPIYGFEIFKRCFDSLKDPGKIKSLYLDVGTNIFMGPSVFDAAGVHRHMMLFQQFSKERSCAVTSLAYGTKQKNSKQEQYARPVDRIMGAPTLRGCASSMLFLTAIGEDAESTKGNYQPLHWFTRHGESKVFNVRRDLNGLLEQVSDTFILPAPTRRDWNVCDYLVGPMTRAEIVKAAEGEHGRSSVYDAITFSVASGQLMQLQDGKSVV